VAGRVAVVTGGSSGIGAATARLLAKRGWRCVLLARGAERLAAVAEGIGGEYDVCDVSDRAAVERVAAAVTARHPELGLLVNDAGIPGRRDFLSADPGLVEDVLRVNYLGSLWCLRAFLSALELGAPSHVVNVVSVAGTVAYPGSGPYGASKHAQLAFSRGVAAQLAARGIHVHTILPGLVETEGFPQRRVLSNAIARRLVADPELVAERIVSAVERNRREVHVPRWYRAASFLQGVAPSLVAVGIRRSGDGRSSGIQ
jgi:short-subunit dehydrogenase